MNKRRNVLLVVSIVSLIAPMAQAETDGFFSLMAWELATPAGIISRWEERLSDVLAVLPFSFKDEVTQVLMDKLHSHPLAKAKKSSQTA